MDCCTSVVRDRAGQSDVLVVRVHVIRGARHAIANDRARITNDPVAIGDDVAEDVHDLGEDGRVLAQDGRVLAQDGHVLAQDGRVLAQDARILAQDVRVLAQDVRVLAQDVHVLAQDVHVLAQDVHVLAQDARILAQDVRVLAQDVHVLAQDVHVLAQDVHVLAQDGRVRDGSSGSRAEMSRRSEANGDRPPDGPTKRRHMLARHESRPGVSGWRIDWSSVILGGMIKARALQLVALGLLSATGCATRAVPSARPRVATSAPKPASVRPTESPLDRAWADYDTSRYAEAEAGFRALVSPSVPSARLGLAKVLLETGRYALAESTATDAAGAPPKIRFALICVRGKALMALGKVEDAERLLSGAAGDPAAREVRVLLGEVLLAQGKRSDAEPVLMTLINQYNGDGFKDPRSLALVGRAAYLLGSAQDANDAFNESERAGPADAETLLWRAELFLDSYDPGHAEEVVGEVLAKAPRQPEALARMAEVKLASNLDFDAAEALAKAALDVNPSLAVAHFVLGGVALRDMNFVQADGWVNEGLARTPRDLDLLSLRAAIRFLADDAPGFARAKTDVLSKNPRYSRLYEIVGEYAEWEHRYDDIVTMMREALLADPEDAKVRAQLGFNLIRAGDEREGVASLERAFGADPFNVRVYNTLNLYEKEIPKSYETVTRGRFTIRYSKDERPILDRYLPAMLDRAWAKFTKKYDFVPTTPIGIELYPVREQFAVRASGLPQTFIQGVCFGRTLAAMSPRDERFNIGMTLWHELAHVFHLQLSKNHVPRWFTEGLAEYETLVERPEWRREYDPDLYQALIDGQLPQVADMNRAFSHAEDMQDMATAYYASTQIVAFIADRWGMPKIRQMLELWGEGRRTPDVVKEALGVSAEDVDREFRDVISARLALYKGQFAPPTRPPDLDSATKAAALAPKDATKQATLALAWMGVGAEKKARDAVDRALGLDAKNGLALWLRVQLAKTSNDHAGAVKAVDALIAAGHDGYAVRMALSEVTDGAPQLAALRAAHTFDPSQAAPLRQIAELSDKDPDAEIAALRQLVLLEENDGDSYRRLMTLLLARKDAEEARRVGEAAIYVDMESAETHRLYGEALLATGARKQALYEFESAILGTGTPAELENAHRRLAEMLEQSGDRTAAATERKTVEELVRQSRTGPI